MKNNLLLSLPENLLCYIYELDTTYKEKITNVVLPSIWLASWKFFYSRSRRIQFNYKEYGDIYGCMLQYLLSIWGLPDYNHKMTKSMECIFIFA